MVLTHHEPSVGLSKCGEPQHHDSSSLPPLCQLFPGLSPTVLPSPGQPIQYARSTCEAGVAELHIQDTLPEDDGTYTCLAENTMGQVSCSARVTVQGRSLWAPL